MPRSATINCARAREPQTTEYSYGRSATKERLEWKCHLPTSLLSLIVFIHTFCVWAMSSNNTTVVFVLFFLEMRGKRPWDTSALSSLTTRVQLSDVLSAIFFKTDKNERGKKPGQKRWAGIMIQSFPLLSLCVSLSLSLSPGTFAKPWLQRSHDFLPESHSIPGKDSADTVKTSFVSVKILSGPASSQNLPLSEEGGLQSKGWC